MGSMPHPEETLWYAVWTNNLMAVQRLLEGGADPDETTTDRTPLMESVDEPEDFYGEDEAAITDALLAAGADVDRRDAEGRSALHYAVRAGAVPVRRLLEVGSDPNVRALDGSSPLHEAVRYGTSEVVELLLLGEAEPSHSDAEGRTPLDLAEAEARNFRGGRRRTPPAARTRQFSTHLNVPILIACGPDEPVVWA